MNYTTNHNDRHDRFCEFDRYIRILHLWQKENNAIGDLSHR